MLRFKLPPRLSSSRVWALLLAVLVAAPLACALAHADRPGTVVEIHGLKSRFLSTTPDVTVWLPPGYRKDDRRHAVLYMNDGQNLFDPAAAFGGHAWGVDKVVARLMAAGTIRPTIVVGIANLGADRAGQYTPQAVYERLPDPVKRYLKKDVPGHPFADDYLRFLVKELKPLIDRRYRTNPGRDSTFIMGSSMGALISLYAVAEYPDVFGGAGCMSPHWPLLLPTSAGLPMAGDHPMFELEVSNAFTAYLRQRLGPPDNRRIWFDHGTKSLDAYYSPYQRRINRELTSLGWRRGIDFQSKVYAGATHNEESWGARLADPLTFLLPAKSAR